MKKKQNRKLPKQARSQFTVKSILEAACIVLEDLGVENFYQFTTTKVAERAGVSIGTLYQYFPNKEALLAEVADYRYRIDLSIAKEVTNSSKGKEISGVIKKIVKTIAEKSFRDQKNLYQVLSVHASSIVRPETAEKMREAGIRFIQDVLEGRKNEINVTNSRYAAFFIVQTLLSIRREMFISRPEYILDENFIEMFSDFSSKFLAK